MTRDHYAVLGVPRDATAEQIKAARRARLREAHPDANPGDPAAAERFDLVCKAAEVLGHPERRRQYDRSLRLRTDQARRTDQPRRTDQARGRTDDAFGGQVRCGACGGSGALGFVVCEECDGVGRTGPGFSRRCAECKGTGRLPDPCFRCDGNGRRPAPPPRRERAEPPPRKFVQNCYEVLGVPPDAAFAQISESYRQIVRTYGKPVPEKARTAYRRIGDPRRRAGYDRGLGLSTKGPTGDFDVQVSPRAAARGADSHVFTVPDRDLCPQCDGVGRIMLPCATCEGLGQWRLRRASMKCEACGGRGTDGRACFRCALSGWVDVTRTVTCRIPAASGENTRITVRDDLLGVVTLRLHLAPEPAGCERAD